MLLWLLLVLWAAAGALFLLDWRPFGGGSDAARRVRAEGEATLLAVRPGPDADPASILLYRDAQRARVLALPAATLTEVPGVGPKTLAGALRDHGAQAFATTVANLLGVRVPPVAEAGPVEVAALVDALGGVRVDIPDPIEVEQEGVLRTLFSGGSATMDGDDFVRFLFLDLPDERELEQLARQSAAWQGLFAAMGRAGQQAAIPALERWTGDLSPDDLARRLERAAREDDLGFVTLPVSRVGVAGEDLYEADRQQLRSLREELRSIRTVREVEGRRLRLLIGAAGDVGPAIARRVFEAGFTVVLTGQASEPYDTTRVVLAENTPELREIGSELLDLLGTGRLGVYRRPQTVFDATLVVGRDWAEANGFPQPEPTPTPRPRRGTR